MVKKTAIFDIVKFVCAFLVIAIHTFPFQGVNEHLNTFVVSGLARIAVPLFFVMSAYFFFQHKDSNAHIKKYISKIGKIYILWSLLYFPFFLWINKESGLILTICKFIWNFFVNGSYYHLWFLPALIFAFIIVHILKKYLDDKQLWILSMILYGIGYVGNIYTAYLVEVPMIGSLFALYLRVFDTTRNGLFFGIPFVILGYMCAKHKPSNTKYGIFTMISFLIFLIEVALLNAFDILTSLSSMYLSLIPLIYAILRWMQKIELPIRKGHFLLRKMSLLIYVSHIIFVILIGMMFGNTNNLIQYILVCMTTLLFSMSVIVAAKYIPILKHLYE